VAATSVCCRYGVDKSRIGVIGSVCIISGSIDVDGLAMLLVSNGESSFYVLRGGIPFWLKFSCALSSTVLEIHTKWRYKTCLLNHCHKCSLPASFMLRPF